MVVTNQQQEKIVHLYTDGACLGNPGPGGWGVVLSWDGQIKELSGGQVDTTNNQMELTAVIKGLEALKRPVRLHIVTDSKYVNPELHAGCPRRSDWPSVRGSAGHEP